MDVGGVMGNDDVVEGFVCPVCFTQLPGPQHLMQHFDTAHAQQGEEQASGMGNCLSCS